jgi:outer membrane protein OmpA-like peptidoglycan-associated protein
MVHGMVGAQQRGMVIRPFGLVLLLCLVAAGCGNSDGSPHSSTACQPPSKDTYTSRFVIGATATPNEPAAQLETGELDMIRSAVEKGTTDLTGYVGAGTNEPFFDQDMSVYYDQKAGETDTDPARLRAGFKKNSELAQAAFAKAVGTERQLDLLGLLGVLAGTPGRAVLLVHSSGLQTTGLLDLRAQGSDLDVPGTLERLRQQRRELPSLACKEVVFVGLGDVRVPQTKLTEGMRKSVRDLWMGVCQLAGADECHPDVLQATGGDPIARTPVPTVPVPSLGNVVEGGDPPGPGSGRDPGHIRLALPSGVYFTPETAEFLPGAAAGITEVVRRLDLEHWDIEHVLLVGHCATKRPAASARTLSKLRARKVADALMAKGVDPRIIQVTGVGYDQPIVPDLDRAGHLIPAAAERNRTVVLTVTRRRKNP